jgi:hypothetical protein
MGLHGSKEVSLIFQGMRGAEIDDSMTHVHNENVS